MNAEDLRHQLELAMWQLAEAESRERAAAVLRYQAAQKVSRVAAELADWIRQVESRRKASRGKNKIDQTPPKPL